MSASRPYLLDSNVFIHAKNSHYAFDICPGFWKCLVHHGQTGAITSIDHVRRELLMGRKTEDLVVWVKEVLPSSFFQESGDETTAAAYQEVMLWVHLHPMYLAKYATEADGWLVAYAMNHGGTVVTHEESAPDSKREIKLPDVCRQFGVSWTDPFLMLKDLGVQFDWKETA